MVDSEGKPLPVQSWQLKRLLSTGRPVTGAVNSTYDSLGQLWVVFGTGRLWSQDDVTPCAVVNTKECLENHQHYIYGIKEELNSKGFMTFQDLTSKANSILDLSNALVYQDGRVTGIKYQPALIKTGPGGSSDYLGVSQATKGSKTIGYRRLLNFGVLQTPTVKHNSEIVISQPKLMAVGNNQSLMSFTSFEPGGNGCGDLGHGYMYLIDTFTGLPSPSTYNLFVGLSNTPPKDPLKVPIAGAMATGDGKPTEAIILSVEDKFVIRTSGPDGSIFDLEVSNKDALDSRISSWREVLDMGFELPKDVMIKDMP
jgi:Tfp pilus tip-associated adhesin PilY1